MRNGYAVVDGHADILYRMESQGWEFYDRDVPLHQNYAKLLESQIDVQVFVNFVDPPVSPEEHLYRALDSLRRFRTEIEGGGGVTAVESVDALDRALGNGKIAALLSLEGADGLNGRLGVLDALFGLGVRLVGLTWNGGNSLADGVGESRGAGLTAFGREVVAQMQSLGMAVDVSHLARRGVFDVAQMAAAPIVASHSNAYAVHAHARNLDDDQIRAIASTGGLIGVTFVPPFIGDPGKGKGTDALSIRHLLPHVDHLLRVAGEDAVAIGSDFDGIETTLSDLRDGRDYPVFLAALEERYGVETAAKIAGGNWLRVLRAILPRSGS